MMSRVLPALLQFRTGDQVRKGYKRTQTKTCSEGSQAGCCGVPSTTRNSVDLSCPRAQSSQQRDVGFPFELSTGWGATTVAVHSFKQQLVFSMCLLTKHLPYARHCSKHFTNINPLHSRNTMTRGALLLSPFSRWKA